MIPVGSIDRWYYAQNKKKMGPVSLAQLRSLLAEGVLKPEAMVFQEGAQKWRPLAEMSAVEAATARAGGLWKLALAGSVGLVLLALVGWGLFAMLFGPNGNTGVENPGPMAEIPKGAANLAKEEAGEQPSSPASEIPKGAANLAKEETGEEPSSPVTEIPKGATNLAKEEAAEKPSSKGSQPPAVSKNAATIVLQFGHSGYITSVAFSPDGKYVLTGSSDYTARLWDTASGNEIRTFNSPPPVRIQSVSFSPTGKQMLTAGTDGKTRLWDVASGKQIAEFAGNTPAFSPDGSQVLTCANRSTRLWDVAGVRVLRTFRGDRAVFSADGNRVLTGGSAGNTPAELWDATTGNRVRNFYSLANTIEEPVAISPDGTHVFAGRKVWDVASRNQRALPFPNNFRRITSAVFSPDSKQLVTGDNNKLARLWDVASGKELRVFKAHGHDNFGGPRISDAGWLAVAFSPDGKQVLTGGGVISQTVLDNVAQLWDAESGEEIRAFRGQIHALTSAHFSPDGRQVLTAAEDKMARLWDVVSCKQVRTFKGHTDQINSAVFSPDGKQVLTGSGDPRSPDTRRYSRLADGRWVLSGQWAPVANSDNTARLWDVASGKELRTLRGHALYVQSLAFSPDGKQVVTASADRTTRLWDVASGNQLRAFHGHINPVWSVAFSPDGKQLLTGTVDPTHHIDNTARLWDVGSGKEIQVFRGDRPWHASVAFSPDGKQVFAGGKVWDPATGRQTHAFPFLGRNITPDAFSPDGKQVLTKGFDGTARSYDVASGRELVAFRGHTKAITTVAFSADGRHVLTGSQDCTVRLWDAASGRELCRLLGFRDGSWVALTPDNYYMASKGRLEGVSFRLDDRLFSFDQFDLKFNRPDKVLESMGQASAEMIAAYRHAWEKRLKRMNVREEMLSEDFHVPEIVVNTVTPFTTREKVLKLKVKAGDSKYLIDRLQIDVNGVPLHGAGGISLRKLASKTLEQELEVELSAGKNKIDVSVVNEKGAESLKGTISINYETPAVKPNLFVVAVGVSDYVDARFRLTYGDKDARDLADLFAGKRDRFGEIKVQRILNRDATRENILKANDFLKTSRVDDLVVLFFAGHGLLDSKLDYYFATADIDFKNPAKRGLPYEAIEDLLDGIRARKKVLLMDTCHSGELDKEEVQVVQSEKRPKDEIKVRTFRGLDLEISSKVGLGNSYQLLQEMFADLRRGTGAVVISSAGGAEYAMESATWKNGVFTHALIRGLKGEAERNKDGRVPVSKLRDFVEQEVRRLTNGRQVPTARRENLIVDFTLD
jgi:WD40 repeat protein